MDNQKTLIQELKSFKRNLSKRISVERIIFFGSRASGKPHKDSDIDLVIVSRDFRKKEPRTVGIYRSWNLDYPVDFLCYSPEEFEKKRKQITIVKEAVETGIEI